MGNVPYDINGIRNIILDSQHLLEKSMDSIESIVSDICGMQYDPNPTIYLNQYIMLWNRKKDFRAEQLDIAAYQEFKVVETWTFKRNLFLVPSEEYSLYRQATKGIVRWGETFRREHDRRYHLPIFRAFYRMCRRGDLLTCGRNPGTFRRGAADFADGYHCEG